MQPMFTLSALAIALSTAGAANAVVLVNDTWGDGERSTPAPNVYSEYGVDSDADGDLESAWWRSGSGAASVVGLGGPMRTTSTAASSSVNMTTHFTPEATPVTLTQAGDQLKITWVFTTGTVSGTDGNTSNGFRIGVGNSPSEYRITGGDGSAAIPNAAGTYGGYSMWGNMATTLNNGNAFQLNKRTGPEFLAGGTVTSLDNEGTIGTPGYTSNTTYTFVFTATRNATDGIDVTMSMSGAGLDTDGILDVAGTDTAPSTFSFDTFGFRLPGNSRSTDLIDTSLFRVEFNGAIPEPASLALLGLGGLAMLRRRH